MFKLVLHLLGEMFTFTLPKEQCSDTWDQHDVEDFERDWVAGLDLYTYDGFLTIEEFLHRHGTCGIDGSRPLFTEAMLAADIAHQEELELKESIRLSVYADDQYAKGDSIGENQMRNHYNYNQKPKNKRCYQRNKARS